MWSIAWLLMPWRRKEPCHQQPWHCPCHINGSRFSARKDFWTTCTLSRYRKMMEDADIYLISFPKTLRWRHNGRDSVSNHQPHDCLLNRLFRRRSKKISKLRVTGLCAGNSPCTGEFPAQMASNAENVSIWWRHHDNSSQRQAITQSYDHIMPVWPAITNTRRHSQLGQMENIAHENNWPFKWSMLLESTEKPYTLQINTTKYEMWNIHHCKKISILPVFARRRPQHDLWNRRETPGFILRAWSNLPIVRQVLPSFLVYAGCHNHIHRVVWQHTVPR